MVKLLITLIMTFGISITAHGIPNSCNNKISLSEIMLNAKELVFRIQAPVLIDNANQRTELKTFTDFHFRLKRIQTNIVELSWDDAWGRSSITLLSHQTPKFRKVFYLEKWLPTYPNQPGTAFLEIAIEGNNISILNFQRDMPRNYGEASFHKLIQPSASCITLANSVIVQKL